jgi:hypothetical protein
MASIDALNCGMGGKQTLAQRLSQAGALKNYVQDKPDHDERGNR